MAGTNGQRYLFLARRAGIGKQWREVASNTFILDASDGSLRIINPTLKAQSIRWSWFLILLITPWIVAGLLASQLPYGLTAGPTYRGVPLPVFLIVLAVTGLGYLATDRAFISWLGKHPARDANAVFRELMVPRTGPPQVRIGAWGDEYVLDVMTSLTRFVPTSQRLFDALRYAGCEVKFPLD